MVAQEWEKEKSSREGDSRDRVDEMDKCGWRKGLLDKVGGFRLLF